MRKGDPHTFKIRDDIENVAPYVPGKPIDEVKRELGIQDVIKLASNEMPFGPVEKVREAIFAAASKINYYPDSHSYYLRQRISERFGVDEKLIVFGNGSSELLKLIADCILVEGDAVIYASPSFVMYPIVAAARGARRMEVPLTADELAHDIDAFLEHIDSSTALVILCNPNNPTGTITPADKVERFLEKLPEGVFVLFDEAYAEFVTDDRYVSGLHYFKEGWPNVGVLRSFSKAYGLAGLRIGYGFLPEKLADAVNRIREPFNINLIAQEAALAALDCESEYEELRQIVISERNRLEKELSSRGFRVFPSQANFIFFDTGMDSHTVFTRLLKKGVIVRDGRIFGDRFSSFIRVSIGTRAENDRFLETFFNIAGGADR